MLYEIKYTSFFVKDLKKLKKNNILLKELEKVIEILKVNPQTHGKTLKKNLFPNKSLRILKKYRLIFEIKDNIIYLKAIGHRSNIYK